MQHSLNDYLNRANSIRGVHSSADPAHQTALKNELHLMIQAVKSVYEQLRIIEFELRDGAITYKDAKNMEAAYVQYMPDINEHVININGILLRGNIGRTYSKTDITTGSEAHQVMPCRFGNKCKKIYTYCKFYHDPVDLLELLNSGELTQEQFDKQKRYTRNFLNSMWLYETGSNRQDILSKSHLKLASASHLNTFKQQIMHDILLLLKAHISTKTQHI